MGGGDPRKIMFYQFPEAQLTPEEEAARIEREFLGE